jgi:succinyl-CoA synthetase alpha subunit
MSIYIGSATRLVVQGTGRQGSFHTEQMIEYGTNVVAGVSRGKGGGEWLGVPRVETVAEAVEKYKANASVIFIPASGAAEAVCEAADAGIHIIICITEGVPPLDMLKAREFVYSKGAVLIGPNCPGLISPGLCKIGIMPGFIHKAGRTGVVSRSGTLTYEAVYQLTSLGIGQSTCVGIGGDSVAGTNFIDVLKRFQDDPGTDSVIMIGEIGGSAEQEAASYIEHNMTKPVVAFIAGATAPSGRRMGHAGAIIEGPDATAEAKKIALRKAGIHVADSPAELGILMEDVLYKAGLLEERERT